ncbi:MAG: UDP-N-acetylmuramoyl-tripeptide--D-alanyl-D-alanine ligase [Aphanocapsa sp. GSE-SYN-MK-11-07L]|jgi:UDP-N-acetylmuramoyl-tripeptide--D-alanyl-D-alanine ligase|nr:UDP-N-acetylmuramoyl-tripeptide--D-alanyl-D-alanine ligase [Aphanocapsa sp. GSE-SYN-MK-11-07L]
MTFSILLSQLVDLVAATPVNLTAELLATTATGISTDTRSLKPGQIFLALRGENFDGHRFVTSALAQGAIAAITDHPLAEEQPQLVVADTLVAYQQLGRWWRDQLTIPVIAVTGSVGKTTTKELIAGVLGQFGSVLKTQANYNNEIGVPKTLLELTRDHAYAVIEMGMRGQGEIACLAQIARPDIAVITNVGTAHIGRLGSRAAIAAAKCELLAELPLTSAAVLNADNPLLLATAATVWQGPTLTYGLEAGDLQGHYLDDQTIEVAGIRLPLPLPGQHNALNYLAAIGVAKLLNLDWAPLQQGLQITLPDGRARRYEVGADLVLLDETYNAGPESMTAALRLLANTPGQRRIAVLGAMKELGNYALELHQQLGQTAQQLGLDALFILDAGPEGEAIAKGALPLSAQLFDTHQALSEALQAFVQPGDRLLFKASHSVGLQQVVVSLRAALAKE